MSDNKVNISGEQINYNDNNVLDALKLNPQQKKTGMIKSIIFTIIAIIVFFVPVTINGSTDIVFGTIYKTIKSVLDLYLDDLQHHHCKWTFEYLQQIYLQKQRVKTLQIL